jgi:hypothetical protein
VYVFRAQEFPDAFERALDLGRRHEETYTGGFGEEVRVRLHSIETLDRLGSEIQDEREVYSEPTELPPGMTLAFDAEFHPESIEPTETGI